ncbi:MAG: heat-inducible transcription repressor HrcA [Nitrospinae bacterium]|nr:heat-inducible transcription repressor HrcA [Nitrospinota bacterium]
MESTLTTREQRILKATIHSYITTVEPVASRTISRRYRMDLSPATIRHVMGRLEELGYLSQPHPSAGRVPTDKGYRFYVDSFMQIPVLPKAQTAKIEESYHASAGRDVGDLLEITSQLLASLTHHAAVVLFPRLASVMLAYMEFVRLRPRQILAIFVAQSGVIGNRVIELDEDLPQHELDTISRYVSSEFAGLTPTEIRARVTQVMAAERAQYDQLMQRAMQLSRKAFLEAPPPGGHGEFRIGGTTHFLDQPEFAGHWERMRAVLRAVDEKEKLLSILDRCLEAEGVHVVIGSESAIEEVIECSLITHIYKEGERPLGVVGILGPKRMEYPRMMSIVGYTANVLSRMLNQG